MAISIAKFLAGRADERASLLSGVVCVDLSAKTEAEAMAALRIMVSSAITGRAKPSDTPVFPGRTMPRVPIFDNVDEPEDQPWLPDGPQPTGIPPDHPDVAINLNNVATILMDIGRPQQALPLAERATAISEAAYGSDHPHVAIMRAHVAAILADLGETKP